MDIGDFISGITTTINENNLIPALIIFYIKTVKNYITDRILILSVFICYTLIIFYSYFVQNSKLSFGFLIF